MAVVSSAKFDEGMDGEEVAEVVGMVWGAR